MSQFRWVGALGTSAVLASLGTTNANAQQIKTVFVIAMENHNCTQPANQFSGSIQQIFSEPGGAIHQQPRGWHRVGHEGRDQPGRINI